MWGCCEGGELGVLLIMAGKAVLVVRAGKDGITRFGGQGGGGY